MSFSRLGGSQEKGERRPNKDLQDYFNDSWESEGLAKFSNFDSDRARPCAGHGKSERQSAPVIKLDEPVPKWLKLWRATRPKPMVMPNPIENVEVFRMDTSEDEAVRDALPAVRALRHDPGGAQLPKAPKRKAKAKVKAEANTHMSPMSVKQPLGSNNIHPAPRGVAAHTACHFSSYTLNSSALL